MLGQLVGAIVAVVEAVAPLFKRKPKKPKPLPPPKDGSNAK